MRRRDTLPESTMPSGYLALILHAHLPFVRHPEHENFLEEEWLFEAITETYIPLIRMMRRLVGDAVPFKLTMSVTPTLAAMLQDELLRDRYVRHLDGLIDLAEREIERTHDNEQLQALAKFYYDNFCECRREFAYEWNRDLLQQLREFHEAGALKLIGCAATHAVLPLYEQTPEAIRAQVLIGRDEFARVFGFEPTGFWLPECAYSSHLDERLQEANIRWTILDAHGLMFGTPRPRRAIYAPCYTLAGPAVFARDRESSRQVWSAREGYPGDPSYREFYRDIGFDLPLDYLRVANGPKFTGIKYHRVTGAGQDKELYNPEVAIRTAEVHAAHFFETRRDQLHELSGSGFEPIIVAPFDAELFGHWWFEGVQFLELLIRKVAEENEFALTSPTDYLAQYPTQQTITPAASSWGANGYLEVWLNEKSAWMYPHLHAAARRMVELARRYAANASPSDDRVLKQLARELLLAQSSDWAFLINSGTATQYATKRATDHLLRFNRLHEQFTAGKLDEQFLATCETRDNLFAEVNWRYYV
ncbi:MAG: glycoside hydrolase family 57 protein [Chthoniobacterales bacterium]